MNPITIFDLGFNRLLQREIREVDSPLVYNSIEDRLSRLVQSGDTLVTLIPGLPESVLEQ